MANKWKTKSSKAWESAWSDGNIGASIGSVSSGIAGIFQSGKSNAAIEDTSDEEAIINSVGNTKFGSGDFNSLLNTFNANSLARTNYTAEELRGLTEGQMAGNVLGGIASGAASGASIGGPWGALAGGLVGLAGGLGGIAIGNNKAVREAERLNTLANEANIRYLNNFANAISNTQNTMFNSSLLNIAAKGGKIYIKPQNRGKFTEYCGGKVTSECIAKGKRSSSLILRKRAIFAENARKWHHALGGNLFDDGGLMHQHGGIFSNGVTFIGNGGTHEENPFEGVQIGVDAQGIPNKVEEGEVIWNDYVFSKRLKPTEEFKKKYKVKGKTFADIAKEIQKESEERPNDPISKNGLEDSMTKLMIEQEEIRNKNNKPKTNLFADGSWLRYAPVAGSALGAFSDLIGTTNKPDYSNMNLIQDATDRFTPIDYTPIGTYLSYNPLDKNFYSARLAEHAGATRRAISNQAINPGSAMSGLLAVDYNAQAQLGDLFRQAEEYNQAQREKVAGFNRQTDAMNAEMAMKAAMANQKADELRLKSAITQAQMREQADTTASAARSANLTNFFDNLGSAGKEKFMMDIIEKNPALLYTFMGEYKGGNTEANGGKINRKRRK